MRFSIALSVISIFLLQGPFSKAWVQVVDGESINKLSVRGFYGDVLIRGLKDAKEFRFQVLNEDGSSLKQGLWKAKVLKQGDHLQLVLQGPESRGVWWDLLNGKSSRRPLKVMISGPARQLQLSWFEGKVSLLNWLAKASLNIKSGSLQLKGCEGFTKVSLMKGGLLIDGHQGDLEVDGYRLKLRASQVKGSLRVRNFSGSSFLKGNEGVTRFFSHSGPLSVDGGEGEVHFESQSGQVSVESFKGSLHGKSQEGGVKMVLLEKSDVRVRSGSGSVRINLPKSSGAWVNVGTSEGELFIPSGIEVKRYPNLKVGQGRLSGSQRGNIYVRTQSGKVIIR